MDETSIYLDFPSNYSYAKCGEKRIKANTAGGERTRMSAAFTASATGKKLPIFIIIPRATPLTVDGNEYKPPDNVMVYYKPGATFNDEVICEYFLNMNSTGDIPDSNYK